MKNWIILSVTTSFFYLCLAGAFVIPASAGEYVSLKGIKSVNTIFDFRVGKPGPALINLKLIHDTFNNKAIRAVSEKPEFAVDFHLQYHQANSKKKYYQNL